MYYTYVMLSSWSCENVRISMKKYYFNSTVIFYWRTSSVLNLYNGLQKYVVNTHSVFMWFPADLWELQKGFPSLVEIGGKQHSVLFVFSTVVQKWPCCWQRSIPSDRAAIENSHVKMICGEEECKPLFQCRTTPSQNTVSLELCWRNSSCMKRLTLGESIIAVLRSSGCGE